MGFFRDITDRLLARMAVKALNRSLAAPYGEVLELRIDTAANTAETVVLLKGEGEPLRVAIERYEVFKEGNDTFLRLHGVTTSREWMNALAERAIAGRAIKLPGEFAGLLAKLV